MAVVKEIKEGACKITVHDDCYINRTKEEVEQTIKNVSAIIHNAAKKKGTDKTA